MMGAFVATVQHVEDANFRFISFCTILAFRLFLHCSSFSTKVISGTTFIDSLKYLAARSVAVGTFIHRVGPSQERVLYCRI